jgi:hypothetical protein
MYMVKITISSAPSVTMFIESGWFALMEKSSIAAHNFDQTGLQPP